jgi:hypothetical protein
VLELQLATVGPAHLKPPEAVLHGSGSSCSRCESRARPQYVSRYLCTYLHMYLCKQVTNRPCTVSSLCSVVVSAQSHQHARKLGLWCGWYTTSFFSVLLSTYVSYKQIQGNAWLGHAPPPHPLYMLVHTPDQTIGTAVLCIQQTLLNPTVDTPFVVGPQYITDKKEC